MLYNCKWNSLGFLTENMKSITELEFCSAIEPKFSGHGQCHNLFNWNANLKNTFQAKKMLVLTLLWFWFGVIWLVLEIG